MQVTPGMSIMTRTLLALAASACLATGGHAADSDNDITLKLKAAIAAVPELQSSNLMVSVQDGVAVIGGAVPSAGAIDDLKRIAARVPGVQLARVNCWSSEPEEDAVQAAVRSKLNGEAVPPTVARGPSLPLVAPVLAGRSAYSPVPPPAPPAPAGPPQFPTIPAPRVPVTPGQDVAAAVEAVRQADGRFAALTLSVQAGTVLIGGSSESGVEAWEFAAAVRRVPGVDKVIVGRRPPR